MIPRKEFFGPIFAHENGYIRVFEGFFVAQELDDEDVMRFGYFTARRERSVGQQDIMVVYRLSGSDTYGEPIPPGIAEIMLRRAESLYRLADLYVRIDRQTAMPPAKMPDGVRPWSVEPVVLSSVREPEPMEPEAIEMAYEESYGPGL